MRRFAACLLVAFSAALASAQTPASGRAGSAEPPSEPRATPQVSAVRLLHARLPLVELDEAPLGEAFTRLGQLAGVNIVVRWQRLAEAGVEPDQPVSLTVRNLRLSQVLWLLMNAPGVGGAELAYRADRDIILVSTAEELGREMIVRTYDVNDLLVHRLRHPTLMIERVREVPIGNTVSVAGGAVAVRPIIGRIGSGVVLEGEDAGGEDDTDGDPEELIRQLIQVITTTIEPDSWAVNGGLGTISSFKGTLVVRNSPFVHQQLGGALAELGPP